jgi:molecular chaperone DnaJ
VTAVDLYALLGLPRAASAAEIERAYRRLARRYHPGVNPGDRVAERLYQQVQEAYVVLGDADRRREYDGGMAPAEEAAPVAFEGFDFSVAADGPLAATFSELFSDVFQQAARQATTPGRGLDVLLTMHLPFEDGVRGCTVPLSVTRHERCAGCQGRGFLARNVAACPGCAGEGTRRWARGHMVFTKTCEACGGNGQSVRESCVTCHGSGVTPRTEVVSISVPAGLESGSRLTVPGHGHAGALGGPSGDLYVTVEIGSHRYFTRRGADLHLTLPLAIHEAAFGAVVSIAGLDGPVRVRVPAGVRSGSTIVVRGRGGVKSGIAERGDIVVTVQLALPPRLDERSRDLLREFGRINTDDVRRGIFDQPERG